MAVIRRLSICWPLAAALLMLTGCGADSMPLGQVTGEVTADGEPVSSGVVHFVPEAGPKASGVLDQQGSYRLGTYSGEDGAVIGRHQVYFSPLADDSHMQGYTEADYLAGKIPPEPTPQSFLPSQYLSPTTSGLSEEVTAGSNTFNFEFKVQ